MGRWPLVGRGPELERWAAALADPDCRGFVVRGAAGVGKSRLAEECLDRAAAAGFRVGRATASVAAGAVPLGAIAHLLPTGVDLSEPVAGFAVVARELAVGTGRQWVLFVDDMHLLDAASTVLLRQLMDTGVLLLIGTVSTGQPCGEAVTSLRRGDAVYEVDLTVLNSRQIEELLQVALGGPIDRRALHELSVASGGNVLYLRELVLGALATGELAGDGEIWHLRAGRLPGTARLTELIASRLATAGSAGQPVLELLALCEPLPLTDTEALASSQVLTALEQAGLIRVAQDRRRTTVSLAHPLYGEVLRAGLPVLRRRTLLLDQAARVAAHGARRRGDLLHIASWRLAATGTADPVLLAQAAVLARHAHDYPQTIALLRALPEKHRTTSTGLRLGDAYFQLGRWDQAEAVLARADALAVGERDRLAAALAADDPDQLLQAADACQSVGADLLASEAATAASAAWRKADQPRRATGAARRAASALARCEGARTPLSTAAQATASLTVREREIALLAAAGNSSKDIADTLALSVRTVENHLQHAYAKLGVTTRHELVQAVGASPSGRRPARSRPDSQPADRRPGP
ncbi:LuxR C-terminal-related transcriptional regulator [Streptomyces sp. NPDC050548]|uniref:helix-turn-helix transcriptional regulator n=1 Tax=Streptomyces sp. NPDC050548 TaxID=3365629 RepID=UPI00378D35EB